MKKIYFLIIFLFSANLIIAQSTLILPQGPSDLNPGYTLKTPSSGPGFSHTNGTVEVGTYVTSSIGYIQTHSPHSLMLTVNNGVSGLFLNYSTNASLRNNVGINTSNPQEKLHVVGNIRASSLESSGNRNVIADANGTLKLSSPVAFSSYLNVNFPISPNLDFTVPFGVENYDLSNNYDNTTYTFTAPVNGIYHFNASVDWSSLTATGGSLGISLYGSAPIYTIASTTHSVYSTHKFTTNTISSDVKLNAGQTVKVIVYQNTNIYLQFTGNYNTYTAIFSGHLVYQL